MARDGSGNYSRVEGPYINGTVADADEINAELDDITTALSDSINRNGTKAFAADQSMGGNQLTDVGDPSANTDAANKQHVAAAVAALSTVYQPLDGDLTAIAALGYTSGTEIPRKTAANTWEIVNDSLYAHLAGAETITGLKTVNVGIQALRINNNNFIFHGTSGGRSLLAGAPDNTLYAWYIYGASDTFERGVLQVALTTGVLNFTNTPTAGSVSMRVAGKTAIPIPASAMTPNTTNGAAVGVSESTTNKVMTRSLDFDQTTQEGAQFLIPMPKSWNESTVTFQPIWTAAAGTAAQTVVWELRAVALSDDDAIDAAFGTGQTSSDVLIATNDVHIGPESSAITIAGTPAEGDLVVFQIRRNVASDDLAADARLLGIRLFVTTNAANDT